MKKRISIFLLIVSLPLISYAGDYSANYNVVLNDENDKGIIRIICFGLGSQPVDGGSYEKQQPDDSCTYFHVAFQNLSDRPITIENRIMRMVYFNYDGEIFLNQDGTYLKDTDVQRKISVNWKKQILSENETRYGDVPLCRGENPEKYPIVLLELHLLWNDKKYFFSLNLPFEMEQPAE